MLNLKCTKTVQEPHPEGALNPLVIIINLFANMVDTVTIARNVIVEIYAGMVVKKVKFTNFVK